MPVLIQPFHIRHRRKRKTATPPPTPPPTPPLVLQSASLEIGPALSITFDRAVDISQIVPGAFSVEDGDGIGQRYVGDTASLDSATTLNIDLVTTGEAVAPGVRLTAGADTGVTAVDNTAPWPGADELALPYP